MMMYLWRLVLPLCAFLGTVVVGQVDEEDVYYYQVYRDLRKCASPFCGGYFLTALNSNNDTECPDGSLMESCYVVAFNFSAMGLDEEESQRFSEAVSWGGVVQGGYVPGAYREVDDLVDLLVLAGWIPLEEKQEEEEEATNAPTGSGSGSGGIVDEEDVYYYQVDRDLRKCAFPFCGGYFLTALNSNNDTECVDGSLMESCYVVDFNFSAMGLDEEESQRFSEAVSLGGVVQGGYVAGAYPETDDLADLLVLAGWIPIEEKQEEEEEETKSPTTRTGDEDCDCSDEEVCIDDPTDDCFGCDCPVVCRAATLFCGGLAGTECPSPFRCANDPECNPAVVTDCLGVCVSDENNFVPPTFCGGPREKTCGLGQTCYDVVKDLCDPWTSSSLRPFPCLGYCAQAAGAACGGFAGIPCGPGLICVDPLGDGCDNGCGGADCGGICIPA